MILFSIYSFILIVHYSSGKTTQMHVNQFHTLAKATVFYNMGASSMVNLIHRNSCISSYFST
jgi:hypothetical protein